MATNPLFTESVDEDACKRFQAAWADGSPLPIEAVLPPETDPVYKPTAALLVEIELELLWKGLRKQAGEDSPLAVTTPPKVEDYLKRFPALNERAIVVRLEQYDEELRSRFADSQSSAAQAKPPIPAFAHYDVVEEIDHGGMGVIFRIRDRDLERDLAIKVLRPEHANKPSLIQRFLEEAKIAGQLQHPGVVPVHELGHLPDQRPYFTMKLIEGRTLAALLSERPDAIHELPRFLKVFEQVCQTVAYAHSRGVIHRDLKPLNIMVGAFGEVQVMDWGLAKHVVRAPAARDEALSPSGREGSVRGEERPGGQESTDLQATQAERPTKEGQVMGTPAYMPPEQARGEIERVDERCDVFSLGAILCEILTGERAYIGHDPAEVFRKAREGDLADALARLDGSGADAELIALAKRCLTPERDARPRDAGAVAEAVTAHLASVQERLRQAEIERAAAHAKAVEERKRRRVSLALAASVLVLALGAGAAGLWYYQDRADALEESQRSQAGLAFDRGLQLCEQGQGAEGLLWLARSLQLSPPADEQFHRLIRLNLAACAGQLHPLRAVLPHADAVAAVAFSPDGQTILTASGNRAELWDAASGRRLDRFFPHDKVSAVAFSPDGKFVLTGGAGYGRLWEGRLWETATGEAIGQRLPHKAPVSAVAFSPDGKTVLTASFDETVRLWEAATGSPLGLLKHPDLVYAAAFSRDGKTVLTGCSDGVARLWDAVTGDLIDELLRPGVPGGPVHAVAFSPDGKTFATGSKTVRRWNSEPPSSLEPPPFVHEGSVTSVAFSPDGRALLAGTEDHRARLWHIASGTPLRAPLHHRGRVNGVAFSPCGKMVATASKDRTVRIWEAGPLELETLRLLHAGPVFAGVFSPDGKTVLTRVGDNTAQLWTVATGERRLSLAHKGRTLAVAFSPDGKRVVTGSQDTAQLWDAATGAPGPSLPHKGEVVAVAFSPDGKTVVTGSLGLEHTARLWEAATGRPIAELPHPDMVWAVAFSPNGGAVLTACGSDDEKRGEARLWDAVTGRPLGPPLPHRSTVGAIAFSPDGRTIMTGSADESARLWDAATGRQIGELKHHGTVNVVAFSPDGRTILTGSSDKLARLWETATLKLLGRLAHPGPVLDAAFSRDGQMVLTGSEGNAARLWHAATGLPLGPPLRHDGAVRKVAFSPDGGTVLTVSVDKTARLWEVPALLEGETQRIVLWTQLITGMEVDDAKQTQVLDAQTWQDRRRLLEGLGGPPAR